MNPYPGQTGYPQQQYPPNPAQQSYGNPMPIPGYPTSGYPAPQPGYPNQPSGYTQGYQQPASGFPQPNQGYPQPSHGHPHPTPGYPQPSSGYSQPSSGYPQHSSGFPQPNPGYPQSQPTPGYQSQPYPPAQTGYPSQQSNTGYHQPNQHQGYPQHQSHIQSQQSYHTSSVHAVPKGRPTVVPANPFDPRGDAAVLREAMKGFGTNEKAIIHVLTRRTNEQRQRIAHEFKTLYGKDLIKDLKSETSGKFEDLLVALMTPLPEFYAKELHDAIEGAGTDEDVLIEVMCTLSNHEIHVIKQAYGSMYHRALENDLRDDTSGHFKRLMTSLCMGNRSEDFHVDHARAREDARSLHEAGVQRIGTDESMFNAIFCSRSFPHLATVFHEYQSLSGHDIDKAIKEEFSGSLEKALRAIVKVVRDKQSYFAERLRESMSGMGTNDQQLIRIMVTRSEIDLGDISDKFLAQYGKTLQNWIDDDCSGHYKKCLLGLLGLY